MSRIGTRAEYHENKLQNGILDKKNCPFCNFNEIENTLIHEFVYWKIILNKFPYSGQENHLMAVPKRHFIFPCEMNEDENAEILAIQKYMKDFYEKI